MKASKNCKCGQCQKEIKRGIKIFKVNMINGKALKLCSEDCLKQHEIVEMALVGCSDLENVPVISRSIKMNKASLRCEYEDRVLAKQADYFDKVMKIREDFQNFDESLE